MKISSLLKNMKYDAFVDYNISFRCTEDILEWEADLVDMEAWEAIPLLEGIIVTIILFRKL